MIFTHRHLYEGISDFVWSAMKAEIDRIYQVKNELEKLHHPVHYIIRSDNDDDYQTNSIEPGSSQMQNK